MHFEKTCNPPVASNLYVIVCKAHYNAKNQMFYYHAKLGGSHTSQKKNPKNSKSKSRFYCLAMTGIVRCLSVKAVFSKNLKNWATKQRKKIVYLGQY